MSRWVLYIALVCALFSGHSFGESRRSSNSGEKTTDKDTEGGWLACDGTEAEACHCEQEEIDCDKFSYSILDVMKSMTKNVSKTKLTCRT
ncbi:hypothetical protein Y032_0621g745 [Ancylostoma ceylanicum]|uniref:Uncharacterized protein n=1 Tax=Ancylostoma ceylanicum TaxID=53326 RepID=A0A016WML1_9BILA|nr:hypothetical protein Y032_0621g745 [Ancylostoma ceylanicum]